MQQRRVTGFFSKIQDRQDALAMIRMISLGFYLLAGVLAVLAVVNQTFIWIDAFVYVVLAWLLSRFNSRLAAIGLLILALALFIITLTNLSTLQVQGRNPVVGLFMALAGFRAVEATFKLHGQFAEPHSS